MLLYSSYFEAFSIDLRSFLLHRQNNASWLEKSTMLYVKTRNQGAGGNSYKKVPENVSLPTLNVLVDLILSK